MIGAKVRDSVNRIARMLFKMAVEQNCLSQMLQTTYDFEDIDFDQCHAIAEQYAKETNGSLAWKEKMAAAIAEAQKIDVAVSDQMTVGEWMDIWLENFGKASMRDTTYETYAGNVRLHVKPYIGELKLNKVLTLDIQKYPKPLLDSERVQRKESRNKPK